MIKSTNKDFFGVKFGTTNVFYKSKPWESISECLLWLEADSFNDINDGSTISVWEDKSPNKKNAGGTWPKPTLTSESQYGKNFKAVRFSQSANGGLQNLDFNLVANELTSFTVHRITSPNSISFERVFEVYNKINGNGADNLNGMALSIRNGGTSAGGVYYNSAMRTSLSAWYNPDFPIITNIKTSEGISTYANGSQSVSNAVVSGTLNSDAYMIGRTPSFLSSVSADIYAVVLFKRVLTLTEINLIGKYFQSKVGTNWYNIT